MNNETTTLDYNAIAALVKENRDHPEVVLVEKMMGEVQEQLHFAATSILGDDYDEDTLSELMSQLFANL